MIRLPTVADTHEFGRRLAATLRAGDLIVLGGPLGAGKTTLVQGIGAGLQVSGRIASPTFVIARVHPGPLPLVHVDAYRLADLAEVDDLDLDVSADEAVTVVEWGEGKAEQLADVLPDDRARAQPGHRGTHRDPWCARGRLGVPHGRTRPAVTWTTVLVLAFDTSAAAVSVDVVDVGSDSGLRTVAAARWIGPHGHSEQLTPTIAACLADAGSTARDMGALVVGTGPGPFTGLRVGLVSAAAMAEALGVPAYGVCSLDGLALDDGDVLVATDARRKEVYWATYRAGVRTSGPQVGYPTDVDPGGATAMIGAGARFYADVLGLPLLDGEYPSPARLVQVAAERVRADAPSDPLTPLYLRRPDAVVPKVMTGDDGRADDPGARRRADTLRARAVRHGGVVGRGVPRRGGRHPQPLLRRRRGRRPVHCSAGAACWSPPTRPRS